MVAIADSPAPATSPEVQASAVDLSTHVGGLALANPVMPASGCFGPELADLLPAHELGAVVTKTTFAESQPGNRTHRLTDSGPGMLNSVGIPSHGVARFRRNDLRSYQQLGAPVVISIGGHSAPEYWRVVDELADTGYAALEVNVSCPNLEHGATPWDTDPGDLSRVVSGVAARGTAPVIVKLSPNLAAIGDTAAIAEQAGATAVTVCNSFPGLAVDAARRGPVLGHGTGGLSGPAVKPLALRMVWQAAHAVTIPVIGCGGIRTARDVAEFLVAGASAVQIGTATFSSPRTMTEIVNDLPALLDELGARRLTDLIGTLTV